jgi:hypothetical protein
VGWDLLDLNPAVWPFEAQGKKTAATGWGRGLRSMGLTGAQTGVSVLLKAALEGG